ncbi:MAG: nitrile hydratase accessory protein [Actinomycetota bacterium]
MPRPSEPEQPFVEPWHAELFATTHALARAGAFTWADWSGAFVAALAADRAGGGAIDGSTYYETWLEALEAFLVERGLADASALVDLRTAWTDAYPSTLHGEPVELPVERR